MLDLDLSTAAHRKVITYPPFIAMLVDGLIGTDALDTDPIETKLEHAWVFQGLDREGRPFRDPEGSGRAAVVLSERREWTGANSHNTAHFPALQMLIYADSTRDIDGAPVGRDAARKCKHIFNRLDRLFHNPANPHAGQRWFVPEMVLGEPVETFLDVHSTLRGSPFSIEDVPGTNEMTVRGEAIYNTVTD